MTSKRSWTSEQLAKAITNAKNKAEVLRLLGLKPAGGNYAQLNKYIKEYKLDIAHFVGQAWAKGKTFKNRRKLKYDIFVENSQYTNTNSLRLKLLKYGLKEAKCSSCLGTEWLGEPIPLELDHINGVRTDNKLENLRILCPNCHARTSTYRGRNKGNVGQRRAGALKMPVECESSNLSIST